MSNQIFNMFSNATRNINPQNMLMNLLSQRNQQAYNQLQTLMQSGANPQQIVQNQLSQMNPQQLQQIKQFGKQIGLDDSQLSVFDNFTQNNK